MQVWREAGSESLGAIDTNEPNNTHRPSDQLTASAAMPSTHLQVPAHWWSDDKSQVPLSSEHVGSFS